jgi:PLP dependent protein
MSDIPANFETVLKKIRKAEKAAARKEGEAKLIAVSKTQSIESLRAALATGQRLFGENRVQEAQAHWSDLKEEFPDIKLHLIGPLQTNKVRDAVAFFDCIETVDREKLAAELGTEMKKQGRALPCFVQVNTGGEEQKAGISPHDLAPFLSYCTKECGLDIRGLMCIPPVDEPPALHFALLKKLAHEAGLSELSMGMSADYERAIALGATYVRVGSALFGERS